MTTTIQQLFQQAQLAEASYSLFNLSGYANEQAVKNALTLSTFKGEFSTAQATAFVTQWRLPWK